MKNKYKDPLKIDLPEISKDILHGAITLGIGIPIITAIATLIGGIND